VQHPPRLATRIVTRREALALRGAGVAVAAAACSDGGSADRTSAGAGGAGGSSGGTATTSGGSATDGIDCVLTPEMTEGPYYLDDAAIRRNITEGSEGLPLRLELTIADASTCSPQPDLMVEIWHADAGGNYSGFGSGGSGTTFLRGGQPSNADGLVTFYTIYPGWYRVRAVHIHLRVLYGGTTHTTQLFFDQRLTDQVFTAAPYRGHSGGTTNGQDGIYADGGVTTTLRVSELGSGYLGTLNLGIRR
jgi:hypothetical protein